MRVIIITIPLVLFFYSCQEQQQTVNAPNKEYSISGKVTYPDNTGISKVQVVISNSSVSKNDITDAIGSYQITGLPSGNYRITTDNSLISEGYLFTLWDATTNIGQDDKVYNIIIGKKIVKPTKVGGVLALYDFGDLHIGNNTDIVKSISTYADAGEGSNYVTLSIYRVPENFNWTTYTTINEISSAISTGNWQIIQTNLIKQGMQYPISLNKKVTNDIPNGLAAVINGTYGLYGCPLEYELFSLYPHYAPYSLGFNISYN